MIFRIQHAQDGVTLVSLRVTLGSLEVTWVHLGSLDGIGYPIWCHFGVTCARLEGTWGHLGRPLGVTWGQLGGLRCDRDLPTVGRGGPRGGIKGGVNPLPMEDGKTKFV